MWVRFESAITHRCIDTILITNPYNEPQLVRSPSSDYVIVRLYNENKIITLIYNDFRKADQ